MTVALTGEKGSNGIRLVDVADSRANLFHHIRISAAITVLVSHAFPLCGQTSLEPVQRVTGFSAGYVAVAVFFCLSGFLITRSWVKKPNLRRFISARAFRIYPGLWVALLLTVFVLGPSMSVVSLNEYFGSKSLADYLSRNGTLISVRYALPGVFESNHHTEVNGSLWTLPLEMYCYVFVACFGMIGVFRRPKVLLFLAILLQLLFIANTTDALPISSDRLRRFLAVGSMFAAGAAFYLYKERILLRKEAAICVMLLIVASLLVPSKAGIISLHLGLPYVLFCVGYLPQKLAMRWSMKTDLSYGVYIYAFPIQQLAVQIWPNMNWWQNILFALPFTLICAALSWKLVEKPALNAGRRLNDSDNQSANLVTQELPNEAVPHKKAA